MEPRARAGKNVGKMNFSYQELTQFLIAHGDSRQPLQETMRVLDEILTEFIQGVSFEASRVAQLAGRQKVKYEDFQFAMRKSPILLGKAAENKELREALEKQRKMFDEDEYVRGDDDDAAGTGTAAGSSGPGRGRKRKGGPGGGGGRAGTAAGQADSSGDAGGGGGGGGAGGAGDHHQADGEGGRGGANGVDEEELGDADDEELDQLVAPSNRRA